MHSHISESAICIALIQTLYFTRKLKNNNWWYNFCVWFTQPQKQQF